MLWIGLLKLSRFLKSNCYKKTFCYNNGENICLFGKYCLILSLEKQLNIMESEFLTAKNDVVEGYGESVFTKMIKAGHRTYFIDVKTTRANDHFISITELRKKVTPNGFVNERNKVFVYQEDFSKFVGGLKEVLDYVQTVGCTVDQDLVSK